MQVAEHRTELDAQIQNFLDREISACQFAQVVLERFTFDEVHDEIPAPGISKLLVDTGKIGMRKAGKQKCLAFEGAGSLDDLLWVQAALAHLLDGNQPVAELGIRRLIDGTEAALAYLIDDAIALDEHMVVDEQSSRGASGKFLT